jgi:two-component system response regulator LytT
MIGMAIIEDNLFEANKLKKHIFEYAGKHEEFKDLFLVDLFPSAELFLEANQVSYDICFFDIELPRLNGMDAAFKLRESNRSTLIIFVTNLTQFAIKGYQVNALDYIIKPINYTAIVSPLEKALQLISNNHDLVVTIHNANGIVRLFSKDISFIEVWDHKLTYHTDRGNVVGTGSLSKIEPSLKSQAFLRCNSCYLVNPKYIKAVEKYSVVLLDGTELKISKPRKKTFMVELSSWLGAGTIL